MLKKVLYITGTRADYGLMHDALELLDNDENIRLEVAVTGMHLMEEFGYSLDEVKKDNFNLHVINQTFLKDDEQSMSAFIGNLIGDLTQLMVEIKPDVVLLLGDRGEMLAGAIVASYLQIPVAHIHGGDVSSTVDDSARHAITKLSNIHFAATEKSASRIRQMGENPDNIFVVGAPGLDSIIKIKDKIDEKHLKEKYNIAHDFILVLQHPVSLEVEDSSNQIKQTLDAVTSTDYQILLVYPNADAGGRAMIEKINEYDVDAYKNIPHDDFIGLLGLASALIGNSSSGIIESSSFKLPVINIGTRQAGREKAENVIDVDYDSNEILNAMNYIKSEDYQNKLNNCINPYGDGKSGENICKILNKLDINDDLLNKKFFELE
ncbi:MAG: UDP-N-acetylglucosamine 2-epimerase (hydrolyzing) [Methanobrevibacter sp.]|uniref:UDP-N-acetylglucosamine 2-epimerase n=1 Tax=Methanobrevibacter sp. TaxID=66852 RepID=UPI0025E6866C|nr:UDP-N-acetylglucosamine 2-epimerase [Methanobrevibacter sp.]MBE6498178.1 UDP-N-acetylglucosamine 2-epimerase (hydrolyzing) [Methanobrevibacter sp.]